jgi:hypothetical protein
MLIPARTWAAFGGIEIEFDKTIVPCRLIFHSEKLKEGKGFKSLCEIDFLLDVPSTRQRSCRFDWLNNVE